MRVPLPTVHPSLLLVPLFLACTGPSTKNGDDSADNGEFCSTLNDGGVTVAVAEGGNDTSGKLSLRVLTDESTDARDPLYVAFKEYTLENVDSGGVKTFGKTSGDGLVDELLGAGNWAFSAAYTRGSLTCLAQIDALIEANTTTLGCPVMTCP
ncbi:MAG: hypothetical protein Q8P41_27470 [Pseudomonadota bacterium]|nr:hypothetical protein [Pseudomonadota bacterium]